MAIGKMCDCCKKFYKKNAFKLEQMCPDDENASKRYILGVYFFDNKNMLHRRFDLCDECLHNAIDHLERGFGGESDAG